MPSRRLAAVALLVSACALASTATTLTATALGNTSLPSESVVTFEGQLNGHQVTAVTLHTRTHAFHASLTDGRRVSIAFPPSQQQRLVKDVRAKGITVEVAKAPPPSHKLRYIVGGIVIVAIVLAVILGLVLSARRRRMREDEEGPRAPARHPAGG